jgi:hypothetical protein
MLRWRNGTRRQQMASVTRQAGDVMASLKARNPNWNEQLQSALQASA